MIYNRQHLSHNSVHDCDVLVIGTGAGGSSCMAKLAEAGLKVIALESGDFLTPKDFDQREESMFPKLFYDAGSRRTHNRAIRVIHGKGVGGSTLHNINLCKRLPPGILRQWNVEGLDMPALSPHFEQVERDLQVSPLSEAQMNRPNQIFARGVQALGFRGGLLHHNRQGCKESGFCELGCSFNAKMNALRVYVPRAVKAGAKIFANTRAHQLHYRAKRAVSCEAHILDPDGVVISRITIHFKSVVISAGAVETPLLIMRSHLPDPYGRCGTRLHLHPGTALCGIFDEDVEMWQGIPQSYECTQFLNLEEPNTQDNLWLITGSAHPVGAASLLPSYGQEHAELMKLYPKLVAVTPMLHDMSCGSVHPRWGGGANLRYQLGQSDRAMMAKGLYEGARILFAAGAKEVVLPKKNLVRLTSINDWHDSYGDVSGGAMDMVSVHPMSTVWMGNSPQDSCTTAQGRWHHLDNLYVADTSLFPTSIGVPPQISAYTMGHWVAHNLIRNMRT